MKATKRITRLCSILLAVVIVMAMSVSSAFAATITVENANTNETYTVYKLFDVTTSGSGETASYSYSTTDSTVYNALTGLGLTFNTVGDTHYVVTSTDDENQTTFVTTTTDPGTQEPQTGTMTAAQLAAALKNLISTTPSALGNAVASSNDESFEFTDVTGPDPENPEETVVVSHKAVFNNLDKGYYFVTSSVGSLCFLQTAADSATVQEKNEAPEVDKKADTPNDDGQTEGTVQIGDTVNYTITITAKPGAEKYVLHDAMEAGLTFDGADKITVTAQTEGEQSKTLTTGTDYTVATENLKDDCDFEITFTKTYLDSITKDTTITVTYSATVNENAQVGTINNHAILDYGDNSSVDTDNGSVDVYTYNFNLKKVVKDTSTVLEGAKFQLFEDKDCTQAISFVYNEDTKTYRVATTAETTDPNTTTTDTITAGNVTITGLAGKTYYLKETEAPQGYNKLDTVTEVAFQLKDGSSEQDASLEDYDLKDAVIENAQGSELPSTGGMGTTVIYIVGGVLVAGAAVLLVTRRRMHA